MKPLLPIYLLLLSAIISAQPEQGRPFSIKGTVVDELGQPVAGAWVVATPPYNFVGRAQTDEKGSFVIWLPKAGIYSVTATNLERGYPSTSQRYYHPDEKMRPVVSVESERAGPDLTLKLPRRFGSIVGKVFESGTNAPVGPVSIRLCRLAEPNYCFVTRVSHRDGKFNVPVADGPFSVEIGAEGFEDWFMNFRGGVKQASENPIDVALVKTTVDPDESDDRLRAPDIVFPVDGANLFGFPRITRLQWSPVPGAFSYSVEIEVCDGGGKQKGCYGSFPLNMPKHPPTSGIKDTTYDFEFVGNQPGRYRIWAVDADGVPGKKTPWTVFYYPWK